MTIPVSHISTMTRWGGVEQMLVDLLTQGAPSRFTHTLLTTSSSPDVLDSIVQSGATIFQPQRRFHYSPEAILQMAQWLHSQQIQVVHGYNTPASIWAGIAAWLAKTPVFIGGEHGTVWSVKPPMAWFNRWAYQRSQTIVANSKASRLLICRRFNIQAEKVRVVYNVVPALPETNDKKQNPFRQRGEIIIGSVGRLVQQKCYSTLVEAAAIVLRQNPNIRFVLVGGGDEMPALSKQIHQLGIQEQFILTGWRADARLLMHHFDVFVSTSLYEPFGNVLIEAALAGKPVIAPRIDGIPEAVLDGITGVLIRPTIEVHESFKVDKLPQHVVVDGQLTQPKSTDPQHLADAILTLADNVEMRYQLGEAGQQRARSMFTLKRYQDELEQIYENCLTNGC